MNLVFKIDVIVFECKICLFKCLKNKEKNTSLFNKFTTEYIYMKNYLTVTIVTSVSSYTIQTNIYFISKYVIYNI